MILAAILVFIVGYAAIAFEHPLRINKTAPALMIGALIWTLLATMGSSDPSVTAFMDHELGQKVQDGLYSSFIEKVIFFLREHLSEISEILFFLLGAMTIVETVDSHQGFKIITNRIKTKDQRKLLWIISIVTFFLSAVLDNLTTSIVMVSLLRRLVHDDKQRMFFVGMVVIAANAGGAWSPIGDVTTTMLWIKGQITDLNIIKTLLLPSLVCLVVPVTIANLFLKGEVVRKEYDHDQARKDENIKGSGLMFFLGVLGLVFVPAFKIFTHLPPYLGMLISLYVIWIVSELLHLDKAEEERKEYTALHALTKIDTPSVLFFLGILLAIGGLQSMGILHSLAEWMDHTIGDKHIIALAIGAASAIVDNVPLVAASQGMYSEAFKAGLPGMGVDGSFWEFLAYTAGTGGSMLIIGSAAGVAVMGMEKINFFWYLKKIGWLAMLGYLAGAGVYMLIYPYLLVSH
jgi:Na+/H+ antiporter NhaD/arsenite permease-like protein